MFYLMIDMALVKLPIMTSSEIEDLIREQLMCRIAFKGEDYPYLAPFQYVVLKGSLYFHFTDYGRKMKLLEKDNRACVQIERYEPDLSSYSFVSLRGRLEVVEDEGERHRALNQLSTEGKEKLSPNFLAAHGINPREGWGSLNPKKSYIIVKLRDVVDIVGLKSP
jgi:hypothetical protein